MKESSARYLDEICFVGDLSSPSWCPAHLERFRQWLGERTLFANLEGPVLRDSPDRQPHISPLKFNLASSSALLETLSPRQTIFSLANNHYEDFPPEARIDIADRGFLAGGSAANPVVRFSLNGRMTNAVCLAFPTTDPWRWRVRTATQYMLPSNALRLLRGLKERNPDDLLIVYIHWGYELSRYPFPADRAWARQAALCGVDLIVGHHPHICQPVEKISGTHVIYSLGNFYLPEGTWFGKNLSYAGRGREGMAALYNGESLTFCRTAMQETENDVIAEYIGSASDKKIQAEFSGMSDLEYARYYKALIKEKKVRLPGFVPVLPDYRSHGAISERMFFLIQDIRQLVRDALVATNIRKPYKQDIKPASSLH